MPDMTIKAIRTTFLRVPWPDTPWLKGHAFGEARNILVLEAETKGGIVGMGYLFAFRPGLRTVAATKRRRVTARHCATMGVIGVMGVIRSSLLRKANAGED